MKRPEFEYPIPIADAQELLPSHAISRLVTKTRFCVPGGPHVWEVDVFSGHLKGLVLAEIELSSEFEAFDRPAWLGLEVTKNKAFTSKNLAQVKRAPLVDVLLGSLEGLSTLFETAVAQAAAVFSLKGRLARQ